MMNQIIEDYRDSVKCAFLEIEKKLKETLYEKALKLPDDIREKFLEYIEKGSTLIHDESHSHSILLEPLELINKSYNGNKCKKLPEKDNPLQPINDRCNMLKSFLNSHRGFDRSELQAYLNLFCFISNPPYNKLEKIEYLLNLTMGVNKTMKYRDLFLKNSEK